MTEPAVNLPNNLTELFEVLQISVRYPRCTRQVEGASVKTLVDDVEIDNDNLTAASWKLMPKTMAKELQQTAGQVSRLIQQNCVHFRATNSEGVTFMVRGLYLVPLALAENLLGELVRISREMVEVVTAHTRDMSAFKAELKSQMKDDVAFSKAERYIPTAQEMISKTGVFFSSFPIAENAIQLVDSGRGALMKQARQRGEQMLDGLAQTVVEAPRQELAAALGELYKLAAEGGRVTQKSLKPVGRALEKLRMFAVTADPLMAAQMDALQRQLDDLDPKSLAADPAAMQRLQTLQTTLNTTPEVRRRRVA